MANQGSYLRVVAMAPEPKTTNSATQAGFLEESRINSSTTLIVARTSLDVSHPTGDP